MSIQVYDSNEKNSYWYHEPDESFRVMVNLKQVVMPFIELIQYNNTTNKLSSRLKGYADINLHLLSEQDHQTILDKIKAIENISHIEYYNNEDSDDSNDDDN